MNNAPNISVIVPVFNGEKYLAETIKSILAQTYQPLEIIVVDDGSTDNSRNISQSFKEIKYVYQENAGPAFARNRGLREAQGDYFAFLDADDLWVPNKLELQIDAFQKNPEYDLVTGYVEEFLSPELLNDEAPQFRVNKKPLQGYSATAILVKNNFFDVFGQFHEGSFLGETISFFSDLIDKNIKMKILPDIVVRRRIHQSNISIKFQKEKNRAILQIVKKSLDQRRVTP
jgi:glycosyltransferase involved in cell wall biosynthesis